MPPKKYPGSDKTSQADRAEAEAILDELIRLHQDDVTLYSLTQAVYKLRIIGQPRSLERVLNNARMIDRGIQYAPGVGGSIATPPKPDEYPDLASFETDGREP